MAKTQASAHYGHDWNTEYAGEYIAWAGVDHILLQEIRDELRKLNRLLSCPNFTGIPQTLRGIQRNTTRRPRRKAGVAK